ncbi:endosome-associated ubiquitin isopeptidase [Phlyctema vagabunda]|uniref:Endosome-associated ubiquitin isopeptidase n=1 Tax=Phlyctema vagabunda TaxID=108571 RepID=A0ABR4PT94_9HELO
MSHLAFAAHRISISTIMAGLQQLPKPMSVKEIVAKAQDFEFNPFVPLKYWIRTADTLLREAEIYEQEENNQQAYLLLMRYATLITEILPSHPSAKDPEYRPALKSLLKTLPDILQRLEVLKPRIELRHSRWQEALRRRRDASTALGHERSKSQARYDLAASDPAVAGNSTTLAAAEHEDLAVKVAHKEIRRRDAARKATRQAGVSEEEEQERRTAGLWDDWEAALSRNSQPDDTVRRNMEDSRRMLDAPHNIARDEVRRSVPRSGHTYNAPPLSQASSSYKYPSISKSQPLQYDGSTPTQSGSSSILHDSIVPSKPPKERYDEVPSHAPTAPPRPEKGARESQATTANEPASGYTFRPAAYLENGNPLRTVFINPTLRETFLEYASANTKAKLETCGMLCGTLISNALFISKLVIPEQESTSDTCETVNESALFDYCASEDLMVLGWIHTHPTQTCFMSSRDLHTHCGYQVMMPESIAIVCAPSKQPSWGCFRLTDPPGMKSILNCRQTGLFHPHEQDNIYTDALRPGHVYEAPGLEYRVVDLRPQN